MGLFEPAWKTENENKVAKAIAYVAKVSDPAELVEIARCAHFEEIKGAAIDRIGDQSVLAGIVREGKSYHFETKAALERITDPSVLDRLVRESENVTVRWDALSRLLEVSGPLDLSPYADVIAGGVRAADKNMLALTNDLELLEEAYDRYSHENYARSKDCAARVHARANEVARERVQTVSDWRDLDRISKAYVFDEDVRTSAHDKLVELAIPEGATQQQLLEAACLHPAVRETALSRITDERMLYQAVQRIAALGSGEALLNDLERIGDAALLAQIAGTEGLEFATRGQAARLAGVEAPFGTRTLVCRECGDAVVYHEAYESYDSWEIIGWFCCKTHYGATVDAGYSLDMFDVGDAPEALDFHVLPLCPKCWNYRGSSTRDYTPKRLKKCACGCQDAPIPVNYSIEY